MILHVHFDTYITLHAVSATSIIRKIIPTICAIVTLIIFIKLGYWLHHMVGGIACGMDAQAPLGKHKLCAKVLLNIMYDIFKSQAT